MKKIGIGIIIFLISPYSWGQILNGKIHEGLSESGIENVRYRVQGYSDSKTDDFGLFKIHLPGTKRGSLVNLNIQKEGYVVINREALKPRVPANDSETLDIYMCPVSKRNELALKHYKIKVNRTINVNFDKAAEEFASKVNYKALAELYEKKEVAEKMADSLAARLARFDPEKASEELTRAMQLYEEGKINEALNLINADEIVARILERKNANQRDLDALLKAADMALTDLQFDKAQTYFEKAVEADTTNFYNIGYCLHFLLNQNKSDRAISYAKLLKRNSNSEYKKGIAVIYLSSALIDQNTQLKAIRVAKEAITIFKGLSEKNSNANYIEGDLSRCFRILGNAYHGLYRFEEAVTAYQKSLEILRKLSIENPERFERYVATGLTNLAVMYRNLLRFEEAINASKEALEVCQKLSNKNPSYYEVNVANNLFNLGAAYPHFNQYRESIDAYEESLMIYTRYAKENPEHFKPLLVEIYFNLSWFNLFVKSYENAEEMAKRTLELSPSSIGVISNLTSALVLQGKYKEAKLYYKEWKDKPWVDARYKTFGEVFLADLKELEEAGIRHPDVKKVRKLLKSKE